MTDRPEPPVPPDVDLRDFRRMPFDVLALDNSVFDLTTDAEEFRAGFRLWCRAWHQVPAGSLPDDDRQLCRLAGLGQDLTAWQKVKAKAMRGFEICSDGRLYHTFLSKIVLEAWKRKKKSDITRAKTRDRVRKHREAKKSGPETEPKAEAITTQSLGKPAPVAPDADPATPHQKPPAPEPQGEPEVRPEIPLGLGEKQQAPSLLDGLPDPIDAKFEEWWAKFPRYRRGSKGPTKKKWLSLIKRRKATMEALMDGLDRYIAAGYGPSQSACGAERWLNDERWTIEEFSPPLDSVERPKSRSRGMAAPESSGSFRHTDDYERNLDEKTSSWGPKEP